MMDDLARLLAERACEQLIIRYAALNDAGDWEGVAALYADDGRMSRPTAPDDFIEGRDAILSAFKARPARSTRHICANISVKILNATQAKATSQILLFTGAGQAPLVGTYVDECVKTDSGWLFSERRGSLDFPH
jgi:ketosteroid isomerase-like protein